MAGGRVRRTVTALLKAHDKPGTALWQGRIREPHPYPGPPGGCQDRRRGSHHPPGGGGQGAGGKRPGRRGCHHHGGGGGGRPPAHPGGGRRDRHDPGGDTPRPQAPRHQQAGRRSRPAGPHHPGFSGGGLALHRRGEPAHPGQRPPGGHRRAFGWWPKPGRF